MPRVHFPPPLAPPALSQPPPEPPAAAPRRRMRRDPVKGMTRPAVRRLARRGGVVRISGVVYDDIRNVLNSFLANVLHDAVACTEYSRRKTVSVDDIVFALRRQGRILYGF